MAPTINADPPATNKPVRLLPVFGISGHGRPVMFPELASSALIHVSLQVL
jgi:hypothetical protein